MSRSGVHVRAVRLDDADEILGMWAATPVRPSGADAARADVDSMLRKVLASIRERIVVAEVNGRLVGALHLRLGPLTPVGSEEAVFASHLTVLPEFRRRGIARSLMGAAVTFAEENAVAHVVAVTPAHSRDTSRFMARLGLSQAAVVRVAPTSVLRSRLPVELPGMHRPVAANRQLGQVLAARRSLRRSQQTPL